ncbi:hypothetical protein TWF694_011377 [Orbilia ellipsospora]|uniref:NACHT domain-containing protein n=1 Tax=Orbilia ellipsospora TaxID=2528407 RepID=A0AAV9X6B2_9PEZI
MAEAIGLAASIIAVVTLGTQITVISARLYNTVKDRKERIVQLTNAVGNIGSILRDIQNLTEKNRLDTSSVESLAMLGKECGPLEGCRLLLEKLTETLEGAARKRAIMKWPFTEKELEVSLRNLEEYKTTFITALTLTSMKLLGDLDEQVDDTAKKVEELLIEAEKQAAWRTEEKYTKILEWVDPGLALPRHATVTSARQAGTGKWFLTQTKFFKWSTLSENSSSILWCYGIPGAGKSTISSLVIDYLEEIKKQDFRMQTALAYFYFDFADSELTTEKFIRNLLKQLAFQSRAIPYQLVELFETYSKSGKTEPLDEIRDLLIKVASSFTTTYLVVDALDECNADDRLDVLDILQDLTNVGVRIFTTSRPHPEEINDIFEEIQADKVELVARPEDISKYIRYEIARCQKGKRKARQIDDELKERIVAELVRMSDGMFLLPKFQLKFLLNLPNPHKIKIALEESLKMPMKDQQLIDETFKLMFENINECHRDLAQKALSWLLVAKSPLLIQDLLVALAVEPGCFEITKEQEILPATILDICSSLVVVDAGCGRVRIAHETIQNYLLRNNVGSEDAVVSLTKTCLNYLSFDQFVDPTSSSPKDAESRRSKALKETPFYKYAVQNWEAHAIECNQEEIKDDMIGFLSRPSSLHSYCRARKLSIVYKRPDPREVPFLYGIGTNESPLHIAARLGYLDVAKHFISKGIDVNLEHDAELRPISEATAFGRLEMVKLLVENGSSIISPQHPLQHPINLAAALGDAAIVEYFVQMDRENFDMQNSVLYTALHECAPRGHEKAVRVLLDAGANWRTEQCEKKNAATLTIEHGQSHIFSILLNHGIDLNAPMSKSVHNAGTPLHVAAFYGREAITREILDLGTMNPLSAVDLMGNTALHNAVISGSLPVVRLLVEAGIDLEKINVKGETALQLAIEWNFKSIERYLEGISKTCDEEAPGSIGSSVSLSKTQDVSEGLSILDVLNVYGMFTIKLKLPPKATKSILDYASYWAKHRVSKTETMSVDEKVLHTPYLSIPILGPSVRRILFRTKSHDQGWSSYREQQGTYEGSYSWIEIRVHLRDSNSPSKLVDDTKRQDALKTRRLQSNVHARWESTEHTNDWDITNTDDTEIASFLSALRFEDRLLINPRAMFSGWECHIDEAEIIVYSTLWEADTKA